MAMRQGGHQVAQKSTTRIFPSSVFRSRFPSPEALGREKSRWRTCPPTESLEGAGDAGAAFAAAVSDARVVVDLEEQPRPKSNRNDRIAAWTTMRERGL